MQTCQVILRVRCAPVTVFAHRRRFLLGATASGGLGIARLARVVRLAAACGLLVALSAPPGRAQAPRPVDDSAVRGTNKGRTEVTRLVTGDPAQINAVVAADPPTGIIAISPVWAKTGSYPLGTTIEKRCAGGTNDGGVCTSNADCPAAGVGVCLGKKLSTASTAGFRGFFDVTVSRWDPQQPNDGPYVHTVQVSINAAGYMNGVGANLAPPLIACTNDSVGNWWCRKAFGEDWAKCELSTCKPGYVDKSGTSRPADNFCAPDGCIQGDVDTSTDFYRFFLVRETPKRDGHIIYYVGSLVLDIPGDVPGPPAKGVYTVNPRFAETFLDDGTIDIPTLQENGFIVDILLPCTGPADCSDGLFCNGQETCDLGLGHCVTGTPPCTAPTPTCDEATDTCTGCTGPADCPDDGLFCNGSESCNLTSGLCAQSGNPCLANQICDDDTDACLNFGACCLQLEIGFACFETNEPDCVDPPPNGAGGVFLGAGSTCPQQNAHVIPEGNGTVFVHVVGPPVDCPAPGLGQVAAACPPSGPYTDPWVSDESAGLCHNFGSPDTDPIPAGFFDPGSDPFTGTVCLRGVPLGIPQYGDADTLISRSADPFDRCDLPSGTPSTVNIEIVALSLESVDPMTVTHNGGQSPEAWEVTVDLSPGGLPPSTPPRTLTATKTHCNGGTYTSRLYVQPRFTFTKVSNPSEVRVLDTGMTGTPPVELVQSDPHPWVSDIDPFLGAMVDRCSDFHANISENNPVLECDCNANSRRDLCDIEDGVSLDCNANGVPDSCDLSNGTSQDVNGNGVPDECEQRGACCDGSPQAVHCTDGTYPEDCVAPKSWVKGSLCSAVPSVCPALTLGSCCNTLAGTCRNNATAADCSEDQRVFTLDGTCANVPCAADLGACCDHDTFGGCTDTTNAECVPGPGNKLEWTKLASCANIDCLHEAIPTVSEWGLVVLTLLLLIGAKIYFARRETATAS